MSKLYEYICKAEVFIAKCTLTLTAALIFTAAVARCLHHPIVWAMDAATFLFAWCVFFSADAAMRNNKLVSIDMFVNFLPKKARSYIKVFNQIVIILFLTGLIGYGTWLSYITRFRAFQGIPGFSYTWVTISVPIGSMLMLITSIRQIREEFKNIKKSNSSSPA